MINTEQTPETDEWPIKQENIDAMQNHFFSIMNPERYYTREPIEQEYKEQARKDAEAFLVAEGFKLIEQGKVEPSIFTIKI